MSSGLAYTVAAYALGLALFWGYALWLCAAGHARGRRLRREEP